MTDLSEELLQIADRLDDLTERGKDPVIIQPIDSLKKAANEVGRAFSGSWFGYHANVYYSGLKQPPPGAHFSQEWGLMHVHSARLGSHGDWREYDSETVKTAVYDLAGKPDLEAALRFNTEAGQSFGTYKLDVLSILETALSNLSDPFLSRLKEEADSLEILSAYDIAEHLRPKGQAIIRDTVVLGQGNRIPPHVSVLAEALVIQQTMDVVRELGKRARQAGSHLSRRQRRERRSAAVGTNVFIGNGRSLTWRELKDFLEDRLGLPVDEFNRVPIAGVTNIARLSEMLESAAMAFLIMTGEDEQPDGKLRARMNVVHEAGLFQGRLGFSRAIVILEEGCEEFSNIEGLG
jgi:hypothetical protein